MSCGHRNFLLPKPDAFVLKLPPFLETAYSFFGGRSSGLSPARRLPGRLVQWIPFVLPKTGLTAAGLPGTLTRFPIVTPLVNHRFLRLQNYKIKLNRSRLGIKYAFSVFSFSLCVLVFPKCDMFFPKSDIVFPKSDIAKNKREMPQCNSRFIVFNSCCRYSPAATMRARPMMKKANMNSSRRLVVLSAPLNSFHTKTPHRAAIMGAPCPRA